MICLNIFFTFDQLFGHLIVIVVIGILVIILPQISTDLFVHVVKLFDFLAAGIQQVGRYVIKSLEVFNMVEVT